MTPEQQAEEILKEAYFDLTTHPTEAGPEAGILLDEFIRAAEVRVAQAIRSLKEGTPDGANGPETVRTGGSNLKMTGRKYCWLCRSKPSFEEGSAGGGTWQCPKWCASGIIEG